MISGEDIQEAEGVLKTAGSVGGMTLVYERAKADPQVLGNFVQACRDLVPDVSQDQVNQFDTVLAHAFMVGSTAREMMEKGHTE